MIGGQTRKYCSCIFERCWLLGFGDCGQDCEKWIVLGSHVNLTHLGIGYQGKARIKNESQVFGLNNWVSSGAIYCIRDNHRKKRFFVLFFPE